MKTLFILLQLTVLLTVSAAPVKGPVYANPVLPGDYPDPSIMRQGTNYWATATTSDWAPLFPILHSRDLIHWQTEGAVFQQRPSWSAGKYWAPEISEYHGKIFIYYVGAKKEGPLAIAVATADHPAGPYTDHGPVVEDAGGAIDPMAITDDSGERYLVWKGDGNARNRPTLIYLQKLTADGLKVDGEPKEIMRNDSPWEGKIVEGPFVLKHGDWFYLFYAGGNGCCGEHCQYGVGVARSKTLSGPYEKNPANPIVTANENWKCTGHGSAVTDPQGNAYFIYHGYSQKGSVFVGRQGLLDKMDWNDADWPVINGGHGPASDSPAPIKPLVGKSEVDFYDDFTAKTLNPRWHWPQAAEPAVKLAPGWLLLTPAASTKSNLLGGILAVRSPGPDYAATALVDLTATPSGSAAGLFAYGNNSKALGLYVQNGKIVLLRRHDKKDDILATAELPKSQNVYLRMTATDGHRFQFSWWTDEQPKWNSIGGDLQLEADYLPPWDLGVRIALTVGGGEKSAANFNWVRVVTRDAD